VRHFGQLLADSPAPRLVLFRQRVHVLLHLPRHLVQAMQGQFAVMVIQSVQRPLGCLFVEVAQFAGVLGQCRMLASRPPKYPMDCRSSPSTSAVSSMSVSAFAMLFLEGLRRHHDEAY
jgi:hypothetical protein